MDVDRILRLRSGIRDDSTKDHLLRKCRWDPQCFESIMSCTPFYEWRRLLATLCDQDLLGDILRRPSMLEIVLLSQPSLLKWLSSSKQSDYRGKALQSLSFGFLDIHRQ